MLRLQTTQSQQEAALTTLLVKTASNGSTTSAATSSKPGGAIAAASSSTGGTGSATSRMSTGTASSTPVSAAQLVADQAALDATGAALVVAQQNLSLATITAPIPGVVSAVGLTVGQQASAGSTTSAITVIDPNTHGVSLTVDVTKIAQVKVGDPATVLPDGSGTPLPATVSYVAPAPASGTAYTVDLALTGNPTDLRDGVQAAVTLVTANASNVLAVPTSAVTHTGSRATVTLVTGSTTTPQTITTGAVGSVYTQVLTGLTAGQQVLIADANAAIPTGTITGRVARIAGSAASTGLGGTTGLGTGGSAGGGNGFGGSTGTRPGG